jgi:murein DD-endopeptidase MepM/ murein hydrolase activator NlpD
MDGSEPPHEGYGNFVKHSATVNGFTVEVWGAHLSSFATATGEPTAPGRTLGGIGSTGCSTGSHLHFSVRVDGLYVDPVTLIP